MAKYFVQLQRTASTSASVGVLTASNVTQLRRFSVYQAEVGSEATPADNAFLWQFQRITTAGTTTAVIPSPLDLADSACLTLAGQNATVEPTYTAGLYVLTIPMNQRNTVLWTAYPGSEIKCAATNAAGIGIKTPTATAVNITCGVWFEE